MPANEFLRVSMLFPSCLNVSVLVFDNFLNLFEVLGSQILRLKCEKTSEVSIKPENELFNSILIGGLLVHVFCAQVLRRRLNRPTGAGCFEFFASFEEAYAQFVCNECDSVFKTYGRSWNIV